MAQHRTTAVLLLVTLLAAGCAGSNSRQADPAPRLRVEGARILDPDTELDAQYEAAVPAAEPIAAPPEAEPLVKSEPPPDVAQGIRVSLDVVDARAAEVLRGLAYQGNVNLVLVGENTNRVTVHLQDKPWTEAFAAVLSAASLVAEWDADRARVLTIDQLRTERDAVDQLERQRPRTEVIPLYSLEAKDSAKTLVSMLSAAGRIGFDEESNALIVTDTSTHIAAVRRAIRDLDRVPPQVMIEAVIVDVTLNDELHYGFDWTFDKAGGDLATIQQRLTVGAGTNAIANPGGQIQFTFLGDNWTIGGVYDLLQSFDNIKILANPKVLAINNRQATIEIIDEIPYQELTQTSGGGQIGTTNFKEVGVKLEVTPRIGDDGNIHLELTIEQSADTGAAINQIPVIQTRRSTSIMTVEDGRIVVLGGLRRHRTATNEDKIPILGDIPGLGFLFRRVQIVDVDTELVLFIRSKLVPRGLNLTTRQRKMAEAIDHIDRRPQIERTDPLRLDAQTEAERARRVP